MAQPQQSAPGGYDEVSKAAITAAMPEVRHADLLFRTGSGVVVHVEIQHRADPEMGRRMAEYGIRMAGVYPGQGPSRGGPDRRTGQ